MARSIKNRMHIKHLEHIYIILYYIKTLRNTAIVMEIKKKKSTYDHKIDFV